MSKFKKLYDRIINKKIDSVNFPDLQYFLEKFDFDQRVEGDHFIYYKKGISEIINIQSDGNMAKPYQVRQIRNIVVKYHMETGKNEK